NDEALTYLAPIADYFLWHNRGIYNRCDDSLVRFVEGKPRYLRRSRGLVPQAMELPWSASPLQVLGTGAEMKNTFCLLKGNQAYLSQHIGELTSLENMENYRHSLTHFASLIDIQPSLLAYDLHPHYQVSQL